MPSAKTVLYPKKGTRYGRATKVTVSNTLQWKCKLHRFKKSLYTTSSVGPHKASANRNPCLRTNLENQTGFIGFEISMPPTRAGTGTQPGSKAWASRKARSLQGLYLILPGLKS